jgi:hypothetical protein
MKSKRIDMNVLAPDAGLVTRFPSNQAGRTGRALATASNVRAKAGRIYSAPGYQALLGVPSGLSPFNFLQMMQLEGTNTLVAGNETDLYAVSPVIAEGAIFVYAGPAQTLTDNGYVMEGYVGGPLGDVLTIEWTLLYGPGTATFADSSSPTSAVSVSAPGIYGFRLSATNGVLTGTSECVLNFSYTVPIMQVVFSAALGEPDGAFDESYIYVSVDGSTPVLAVPGTVYLFAKTLALTTEFPSSPSLVDVQQSFVLTALANYKFLASSNTSTAVVITGPYPVFKLTNTPNLDSYSGIGTIGNFTTTTTSYSGTLVLGSDVAGSAGDSFNGGQEIRNANEEAYATATYTITLNVEAT